MAATFRDKVTLVTGGGSGIGRATALAFAVEGAKVVVADRAEAGGHETVATIQAAGGSARFVRADVTVEADVVALIAATIAAHGRLDCAFNNAGISAEGRPIHEWSLDDFRTVLAVNLEGVFLCLKHELPVMVAQGGGAIVNNASIAGLRALRAQAPYVASKHAVLGLTKVAALEYVERGVRVNAVCPGWTDTAILERIKNDPEVMRAILDRSPMKRLGRPEEVAAAVLWLCSDVASFATGHPLVIDGGLMA